MITMVSATDKSKRSIQRKLKYPVAKICIIFFVLLNLTFVRCSNETILPEKGICAHRGANNTHPENTLSAFKEAVRLGVHMIEFDVQMTKDSALVIIHDDTVNRTTNGQGIVSDYSLTEIKKLDAGFWKDPKYKGEKIPTLSEVLKMMPRNIWLNIHIKEDKTNASAIAKTVAHLIIKNKQWHQAVVACKTKVRQAIQKIDQRIKICNMERLDNSADYVDKTILMKANFIQLKSRADSLLPELIPRLKESNVSINYYGIGSAVTESISGDTLVTPEEKLSQLFEAGVDFPLVDEPDKMIKITKKFGIKTVTAEY